MTCGGLSGFHAFFMCTGLRMKGNDDTWMKFAEVNEGKHSFFFAIKTFPPCDPSSLAAASLHSVPVAASLCALAERGLSWFLRKPCCLTHLLTTQTGARPSGLPHLQESISGVCSEHSSWLQFSGNYLNFCKFGFLVLDSVWVGNKTFEDTINLPKYWLFWLWHNYDYDCNIKIHDVKI